MNKEKSEKEKERDERTREEERKKKAKHWKSRFLDFNSSVEVGYGLCYFVVKLLIANDMYWVIL